METKKRFKMYKAGKKWLIAGIAFAGFSLYCGTAQAATTDTTTPTIATEAKAATPIQTVDNSATESADASAVPASTTTTVDNTQAPANDYKSTTSTATPGYTGNTATEANNTNVTTATSNTYDTKTNAGDTATVTPDTTSTTTSAYSDNPATANSAANTNVTAPAGDSAVTKTNADNTATVTPDTTNTANTEPTSNAYDAKAYAADTPQQYSAASDNVAASANHVADPKIDENTEGMTTDTLPEPTEDQVRSQITIIDHDTNQALYNNYDRLGKGSPMSPINKNNAQAVIDSLLGTGFIYLDQSVNNDKRTEDGQAINTSNDFKIYLYVQVPQDKPTPSNVAAGSNAVEWGPNAGNYGWPLRVTYIVDKDTGETIFQSYDRFEPAGQPQELKDSDMQGWLKKLTGHYNYEGYAVNNVSVKQGQNYSIDTDRNGHIAIYVSRNLITRWDFIGGITGRMYDDENQTPQYKDWQPRLGLLTKNDHDGSVTEYINIPNGEGYYTGTFVPEGSDKPEYGFDIVNNASKKGTYYYSLTEKGAAYVKEQLKDKYDFGTNLGEPQSYVQILQGYTITVYYKDVDSGAIIGSQTIKNIPNTKYDIQAPEIKGYFPGNPQEIVGTFTNKNQEFTILYKSGPKPELPEPVQPGPEEYPKPELPDPVQPGPDEYPKPELPDPVYPDGSETGSTTDNPDDNGSSQDKPAENIDKPTENVDKPAENTDNPANKETTTNTTKNPGSVKNNVTDKKATNLDNRGNYADSTFNPSVTNWSTDSSAKTDDASTSIEAASLIPVSANTDTETETETTATKLPQTGDKKNAATTIVGAIMLVISLFGLGKIFKRREN
ncbi:KxYKxGKxW signal peptide domain-containing protein [Lentilactobacillus sp. Marseille-Q4993]|uniref:KxYKxGKxW signal peptide domain-containing protein n=1 Tax=Lentilactobacillus sp. Marseille-Q4993 TaxID=3039492 RepID=UPI0024BD2B07|nr:KxYKxGKxW signal peptide domain-containing protein [Lentilactobacillus sp. Marseille-Q4993]